MNDTARMVPVKAALGRPPLLNVLSWTYVMMERAPAYASSQVGRICSSGNRWPNWPTRSFSQYSHYMGENYILYSLCSWNPFTFVSELKCVWEGDTSKTGPVTARTWVWIWWRQQNGVIQKRTSNVVEDDNTFPCAANAPFYLWGHDMTWHDQHALTRARVTALNGGFCECVHLTKDLWRRSHSVVHSMYPPHFFCSCHAYWKLHSRYSTCSPVDIPSSGLFHLFSDTLTSSLWLGAEISGWPYGSMISCPAEWMVRKHRVWLTILPIYSTVYTDKWFDLKIISNLCSSTFNLLTGWMQLPTKFITALASGSDPGDFPQYVSAQLSNETPTAETDETHINTLLKVHHIHREGYRLIPKL